MVCKLNKSYPDWYIFNSRIDEYRSNYTRVPKNYELRHYRQFRFGALVELKQMALLGMLESHSNVMSNDRKSIRDLIRAHRQRKRMERR
jgi:hypothetical protein